MAKTKVRAKPPKPRPVQPSAVRTLAPAAALVAMTLLAYLPAMSAGFIWDDPDYVTNNANLRSPQGLWDIWFVPRSLPQYYPMVHTTFWLEYQAWGLWSPGYHVVNILLHAASAVLLLFLLRKLRLPAAWLAAAVFALHPVHVESVAWVTERKNVLSGLLYLAAMWKYLNWSGLAEGSRFGFQDSETTGTQLFSSPENTATETTGTQLVFSGEKTGGEKTGTQLVFSTLNSHYWWSLAFFVLALLSKTVTCSLPAALLLVLWWKRGRLTRQDVLPLVPFFVLGAAAALTTSYLEKQHVGATGAEFDFSAIDRILIAGRAVWFYLTKLIAPLDLSFIYPQWSIDPGQAWQFAFPLAAMLTVAALFLLRQRIGRGPLVAILFFGGTLLPALGFVNVYPMRYAFVADHFQYLASIGPIILFAAIMHRMINSSRPYLSPLSPPTTNATIRAGERAINRDGSYLFPLLAGALVVVLGGLTFRQARVYHDTLTLWTDAAQKNPNSWMVHTNLGHALVEVKRLKDAQAEYETSLKLAPNLPEPHWNVGIGLSVNGDYDGALRRFDEAIRLDPTFALAYYSRGNVYLARGRLEDAVAQYRKAVELKKDYAEAYFNLGVIAERQQRLDDARRYYSLAVANKLDYADAHYNLGNVLLQARRFDDALVHYSQVIRIQPRRAEAHVNLGATFMELKRYEDARQAYMAALAIDPRLWQARRGMERAMKLRGL
ncbi:MAG: tetratricopeptide repeat protein [Tepidisphaeraceae bacterium]